MTDLQALAVLTGLVVFILIGIVVIYHLLTRNY